MYKYTLIYVVAVIAGVWFGLVMLHVYFRVVETIEPEASSVYTPPPRVEIGG